VLGAMLEDQEAKWLAGTPVELDKYCTLLNAQRRVLADIGLERRARDVTPKLSDYLDAKALEGGGGVTVKGTGVERVWGGTGRNRFNAGCLSRSEPSRFSALG